MMVYSMSSKEGIRRAYWSMGEIDSWSSQCAVGNHWTARSGSGAVDPQWTVWRIDSESQSLNQSESQSLMGVCLAQCILHVHWFPFGPLVTPNIFLFSFYFLSHDLAHYHWLILPAQRVIDITTSQSQNLRGNQISLPSGQVRLLFQAWPIANEALERKETQSPRLQRSSTRHRQGTAILLFGTHVLTCPPLSGRMMLATKT